MNLNTLLETFSFERCQNDVKSGLSSAILGVDMDD